MAKIMKTKANHMFLGDFNLNLLHLQQREKIQEYLDKFLTRGLIPRITLPTRFSKKGCTLIDQIYCKFVDPLHESSSAIFVTKLSDHFPCLFSIRLEPKEVERAKFISIQKFTDKNIANYENEIANEISDVKEEISNEIDADKGYEILEQFLQVKHNRHFPIETVRFNRYKHKIQPWIEFSLMKSIKKGQILQRPKKNHHSHPDYETKKQNLMTYNKILKSTIRDLKHRFYHAEFAKYTSNMKMTWRTIGVVMSKKAKKDDLPQYFLLNETKKVLKADGSTKEINIIKKLDTQKDIANTFNKYFASIGLKLAEKIQYNGDKNIHTFLNKTISSKFQLTTIEESDIKEIFTSLTAKNSSGYDKQSTFI